MFDTKKIIQEIKEYQNELKKLETMKKIWLERIKKINDDLNTEFKKDFGNKLKSIKIIPLLSKEKMLIFNKMDLDWNKVEFKIPILNNLNIDKQLLKQLVEDENETIESVGGYIISSLIEENTLKNKIKEYIKQQTEMENKKQEKYKDLLKKHWLDDKYVILYGWKVKYFYDKNYNYKFKFKALFDNVFEFVEDYLLGKNKNLDIKEINELKEEIKKNLKDRRLDSVNSEILQKINLAGVSRLEKKIKLYKNIIKFVIDNFKYDDKFNIIENKLIYVEPDNNSVNLENVKIFKY